jgi:hypothetical protein
VENGCRGKVVVEERIRRRVGSKGRRGMEGRIRQGRGDGKEEWAVREGGGGGVIGVRLWGLKREVGVKKEGGEGRIGGRRGGEGRRIEEGERGWRREGREEKIGLWGDWESS